MAPLRGTRDDSGIDPIYHDSPFDEQPTDRERRYLSMPPESTTSSGASDDFRLPSPLMSPKSQKFFFPTFTKSNTSTKISKPTKQLNANEKAQQRRKEEILQQAVDGMNAMKTEANNNFEAKVAQLDGSTGDFEHIVLVIGRERRRVLKKERAGEEMDEDVEEDEWEDVVEEDDEDVSMDDLEYVSREAAPDIAAAMPDSAAAAPQESDLPVTGRAGTVAGSEVELDMKALTLKEEDGGTVNES